MTPALNMKVMLVHDMMSDMPKVMLVRDMMSDMLKVMLVHDTMFDILGQKMQLLQQMQQHLHHGIMLKSWQPSTE